MVPFITVSIHFSVFFSYPTFSDSQSIHASPHSPLFSRDSLWARSTSRASRSTGLFYIVETIFARLSFYVLPPFLFPWYPRCLFTKRPGADFFLSFTRSDQSFVLAMISQVCNAFQSQMPFEKQSKCRKHKNKIKINSFALKEHAPLKVFSRLKETKFLIWGVVVLFQQDHQTGRSSGLLPTNGFCPADASPC